MPPRHAKALSASLTAGALLLAIVATASLPAAAQARKALASGVDLEAVTGSPPGDETEAAEEATSEEPPSDGDDLLVTADEGRVPDVGRQQSLDREKSIEELLARLRSEDMERPQLKLLTTRLRRSCQLALSEMSIMLAQASMLRRELDADARDLRRKHARILAELSSGHYIPAEVKDAVRGLAAEGHRYDGLFQEAAAAGEGLDPRIQDAEALATAALEYVQELETADDSPLGRTIEDRELLQRLKDAAHDLDTRVTTARSLATALAEIADTCAENAALAAEGLVAIHQALAGSEQRGLLQPVATRLSRETLVRAGHDLQQIPTGIAIALSPPAGGSWLDVLPTRLGSAEEVGARAVAAAILLALVIAGWRAGPAKLRAYMGDEAERSADIAALLALLRALALYLAGLAVIALLALTPAWSALLGAVLAWVALWVLCSGALGAPLRFQA
ncbi:MAG: hypothetical protein PVH68_17560, partial [Armatimonadota bacterium]